MLRENNKYQKKHITIIKTNIQPWKSFYCCEKITAIQKNNSYKKKKNNYKKKNKCKKIIITIRKKRITVRKFLLLGKMMTIRKKHITITKRNWKKFIIGKFILLIKNNNHKKKIT